MTAALWTLIVMQWLTILGLFLLINAIRREIDLIRAELVSMRAERERVGIGALAWLMPQPRVAVTRRQVVLHGARARRLV